MAAHDELLIRRLLDADKRLRNEKLSRRIAVVTDDSPLTIEIDGIEHVGVEKIAYTPTIGDKVWVSNAGGDLVVHGEIGSSGGGGGSYSPPIPQSDVTDLPGDLAALVADVAALQALALLAAYTNITNTFTAGQVIDLGATGTGLTIDVHTGGGEKWINFTEGGAARGSLAEFLNLLVLTGETGLALSTVAGDVSLTPAGDVSVNSKRIKSVADATAATDAMNRQFSDGRYQPLNGNLTSIAALTTTAHGRGLLDDADAAASRASIGAVIGTDVQAYDAELTDLKNITDEWVLVHDFGIRNEPLDANTAERLFCFTQPQLQAIASVTLGTIPNMWRCTAAGFPSFTGKTLKFRLRVMAMVNGTDPNCDIDVKLKPVTMGGAADAVTVTLGAAAATAQITNTALGTNEHEEAVSSSFSAPTDDLYACSVTLSATLANNAVLWVGARLERRWE